MGHPRIFILSKYQATHYEERQHLSEHGPVSDSPGLMCRQCGHPLALGEEVVSKIVGSYRSGGTRRELYCFPCAEELCIV
jgi:hypothetical protein